MKLPTRIRIGRKKYAVTKVPTLPRSQRGRWSSKGTIWIGHRTALGTRYTEKNIAEAFWHELTHALLHDMQHPLWRNEEFVTAFAKKLSNAINSAEFE